jgi:dihydropteroate synthase
VQLDCAGQPLDLSRPQVMGVLNITPDSFSDGGEYLALEKAVDRALQMQAEGATIIDVGGESTRPGARPVSVKEELRRVIPVIDAVRSSGLAVPISIDTQKPKVMQAAVRAGAGFINDVNALRSEGALEMAAELEVPVCLMHMSGNPLTMQDNPCYVEVVAEVRDFLVHRADCCVKAGIARNRLVLDPGFGFGKTVEQNLRLLEHLPELTVVGFPVLVGLSRKSMIGKLLGLEVADRLPAGIALAVLAVERGALIVRTHDVAATWQALQMSSALRSTGKGRL